MSIKQKAVTGVKWNVVTTIYSMLIQILRLSILTYLLDKSDFGIIAIAMMAISFADIFSEVGMTVAVIHKQNITSAQYSSVYWMNVGLSIILFALLICLSPLIADFYKQPILSKVVSLLGIQILLNGFGKMFQTIKTKNMEFGFLSKIRILSVTIGFIVTIYLAWKGFGVLSLVYGQLVQVAINQGILAIEGLHTEKIVFHFNFTEIEDFFKIGVFRLGSQVLDFLASKIDVFLIGRFFGMDDLGVYNIAKDLILKPYSIIGALVNNVATSAFAKIQNNLLAVKENYKKVVKIMSVICFAIYATIFVFADTIVNILYDSDFADVAVFLRIFVLIGIVDSINGQASILQIALGRTDIGFKWTLFRVITTTITIFITSYFTIYVVAYAEMWLIVFYYFAYWKMVIFPLSTITFKEYIGVIKESFLVSLACMVPFTVLLQYVDISLTMQIVLGALFVIIYASYYWFIRKDYTMEILNLIRRR